jgi:hypothetical protein
MSEVTRRERIRKKYISGTVKENEASKIVQESRLGYMDI